jgi:hypothetical protein
MITKFDKKNLPTLRDEIDAALVAIAEKHGVTIHAGSCSFGEVLATFKLEVKVADPKLIEEEDRRTFRQYCGMFGLEPKHFHVGMTLGGRRQTLIGLDLKRRKYPLRFRDGAGTVTLYTEDVVAKILATSSDNLSPTEATS